MDEITTAITEIKAKVSAKEWQQRILDCQSSGMSIKEWCRQNGITPGSYYFHLRKLREALVEENRIVPLKKAGAESSGKIEIQADRLHITLPESVSPEQLTAVLTALKPC